MGWGPSQMSWSPRLLIRIFIWLFLPPDPSAASGLPIVLSHVLDWSCPYTRTCFALTEDIYSICYAGALQCLDTPSRSAACWQCCETAASSRAPGSSSIKGR